MAVNRDKPDRWAADTAASVGMYNEWFVRFAPQAFQEARVRATDAVEQTLLATDGLRNINAAILRANPHVIATLRMATCPPIAVDRLIGLSGVRASTVDSLEKGRLPPRLSREVLDAELGQLGDTIEGLADRAIFRWLATGADPSEQDLHKAATIVADRLCGSIANPIIRNAQEARQLAVIREWLEARQYRLAAPGTHFRHMEPGTFSFRSNVAVTLEGGKNINIPVDAVVMPSRAAEGDLPVLIEAKSAGDFANVNKRRKEEATKMVQLRHSHGPNVVFVLFLCGYFDNAYLSYEAAEGIDWIWEHRPDDLALFGL